MAPNPTTIGLLSESLNGARAGAAAAADGLGTKWGLATGGTWGGAGAVAAARCASLGPLEADAADSLWRGVAPVCDPPVTLLPTPWSLDLVGRLEAAFKPAMAISPLEDANSSTARARPSLYGLRVIDETLLDHERDVFHRRDNGGEDECLKCAHMVCNKHTGPSNRNK